MAVDPMTMAMILQGAQQLRSDLGGNEQQQAMPNMQVLGGVQSPTIQPQQAPQTLSPIRQAGRGALQGYAMGGLGGAIIGGGVPLVANWLDNRKQKQQDALSATQFLQTPQAPTPFQKAMMQQLQSSGGR